MNLRNVTIWTTGVVMIMTVVVLLFVFGGIQAWQGDVGRVLNTISTFGLIWLLSGSPMLVSLIIAVKSKHNFSLSLLLVSTIAFAIWYGYVLYVSLSHTHFPGLAIVVTGVMSLPVMIPAWITVLILNWRYTQTSATPSPPALLEGENEVQ